MFVSPPVDTHSGQRGPRGTQTTIVHRLLKHNESNFSFFLANEILPWRHTWVATTPAPTYNFYFSCWLQAKISLKYKWHHHLHRWNQLFQASVLPCHFFFTWSPFAIWHWWGLQKMLLTLRWWWWRKTTNFRFLNRKYLKNARSHQMWDIHHRNQCPKLKKNWYFNFGPN